MNKLLEMKAQITEVERQSILEGMLGYSMHTTLHTKVDTSILQAEKRKKASEEVITYMTQLLKEEFNMSDSSDALLKWEEYKEKHGIIIKE